ncbi:MAG: hypothetical protein IMZ44_07600 [Planctomycetes bacterium]|nr:hypothetical protein [Planctomycetota bacterium]
MLTELATISTDDLIDELFKRFDHSVFLGEARTTRVKERFIRRSRGNRTVGMGLCANMITCLADAQHSDEHPTLPGRSV